MTLSNERHSMLEGKCVDNCAAFVFGINPEAKVEGSPIADFAGQKVSCSKEDGISKRQMA